ncbi:hypothetical protein CLG96_05235 [Sphingomonas oleivorans]|uniref:Acyltransferase 3 domain-containing protein n=1 Tax=Sphingomonas oleivorans TaxID=1735121 RepID=A0A2T5G3D5_9SPHN|nr:hypothetical protein CLG96_05235 [Sphingomonas oleivorans]
MRRHYGLDWLRIGAFLLLILFHIGLYLSPWDWHVSSARPVEGVVYFLFLTNPWRMSLLFLVSGYAARAVLARAGGPLGFARSRSLRLGLPLLFGAALVVAPQPWVEASYKLGYAHGFLHFWLHDYFDFDGSDGIATPLLGHLWFVAYIWAYSLVLALFATILPRSWQDQAQAGFARIFTGWRLLLLPMLWQGLVRLVLLPGQMPSNHLPTDLPGHLVYFPAFLFGFGLARAESLWPSILRFWKPALAVALIGYAGTVWDHLGYPGLPLDGDMRANVNRGALVLSTWTAIIGLLGLAQRHLDCDHRWRSLLNEAVFPFYIIHQTIIVLVGWWLIHRDYGDLAEFLILVSATLSGCTLFYLAGRRIRWLRPLIGLPLDRKGASRLKPAPDSPRSPDNVPVRSR